MRIKLNVHEKTNPKYIHIYIYTYIHTYIYIIIRFWFEPVSVRFRFLKKKTFSLVIFFIKIKPNRTESKMTTPTIKHPKCLSHFLFILSFTQSRLNTDTSGILATHIRRNGESMSFWPSVCKRKCIFGDS